MRLPFDIAPGQFARINGTVWCLKHISVDGELCFQDLATGNLKQIAPTNLLRLWNDKEAQINVSNPSETAGWQRKQERIDFASLPHSQREYAQWAKTILDEIRQKHLHGPIAKEWPLIIADVCKRKNLESVSWQQARRLMRKYQVKWDIRSLLPGFDRRGAGRLRQSPEERTFFEGLLAAHMSGARPTIMQTFRTICAKYDEARRENLNAKNWKTPKYDTVRRRLQEIDPYEMMRARKGQRAADAFFGYFGKRERPLHVMEVVEIDHTVLDIMVVDKRHGYVVGRPTLTAAVDVYSGMVVGVYIGLEPAGTSSVMQCLHNMILPKFYMHREYPRIAETGLDWPAYGIPTTIIVDNGQEFHGDSFNAAAEIIGSNILYAPVNTPQAKAVVERFNETGSTSALSGLPGRTFHNPQERGDYDSDGEARLTLQDLRERFHTWLVTEYHNWNQPQFNESRLQMWMKDVERNPVHLPEDARDLDLVLGLRKEAMLTKEGITYLGLRYCSPELNAVRRDPAFVNSDSRMVNFVLNESDLGAITVIHPVTKMPFTVRSATPAATDGLTHFQLKAIRKRLREDKKDPDNAANIEAGRKLLMEQLDEYLARPRAKDRKRASRGVGGENTRQPRTPASEAFQDGPQTPPKPDPMPTDQDDSKYRAKAENVKSFLVPKAATAARPGDAKVAGRGGFRADYFNAIPTNANAGGTR